MQITGLPEWAQKNYQCFERGLARPETNWKFDKNWEYYADGYAAEFEHYLGLDETLADQDRPNPGRVELKHSEGYTVTAAGTKEDGYYVEADDESVHVARFGPNTVDHLELKPDGTCEWTHVERANYQRSYILNFEVDPSRLDVEQLTSPRPGGGVEVDQDKVVVGGSHLRHRRSEV